MRPEEQIRFYKTQQWKKCREGYYKAHPLCEVCLKMGIVTPGEIVHHKEHVTPSNLDDNSILTNWDNLETLCRDHHGEAHSEYKDAKRYKVDEYGNVYATKR